MLLARLSMLKLPMRRISDPTHFFLKTFDLVSSGFSPQLRAWALCWRWVETSVDLRDNNGTSGLYRGPCCLDSWSHRGGTRGSWDSTEFLGFSSAFWEPQTCWWIKGLPDTRCRCKVCCQAWESVTKFLHKKTAFSGFYYNFRSNKG